MIQSMTGYGDATVHGPTGEISIEMKSVNSRFLDLNVKLPRECSQAEPAVRDLLKRRLRRGKVDMFIRYVPTQQADAPYQINAPVLQAYVRQATDALGHVGVITPTFDLGSLIALPGVLTANAPVARDEIVADLLLEAVEKALLIFEKSRQTEGQELKVAIEGHLAQLTTLRTKVEVVKDELLEEYRSRLKDRMETLGKTLDVTLDPIRIETEIMLFADKSDVTEELVRLDAHLKAFHAALNNTPSTDSIGKTLDFLVQELLRETNTIGNKARGVAVANHIVQMKSEIEKIREQVQNLE